MSTTTARGALPYPEGGDDNDVPTDMQSLADQLAAVGVLFDDGLASARPAASSTTIGMWWYSTDTTVLSYCPTAAVGWIDLPLDLAGYLTTAAAAATYLSQANAASTYMAKAGGTFTGAVAHGFQQIQDALLRNYRELISTVAASGAARTLDPATAPIWDVTLDANCTFTFNGSDGDSLTLVLRQPASLKTVTWPAAVKWPSGSAPVMSASTVNFFGWTRVNGLWLSSGLDVR